jgi:hypothetical protein
MNRSRLQSIGSKLRGSATPASPAATGWAKHRGASQYHGQYDVIGNFPGYANWAALIVNARVEVTSHYLLVDELAAHGFGIPLNHIIEYSVDRDEASFGDIVIHYRPEHRSFIFRLRPSRGRIPVPTRTNPTVLAAALADNGLAASEFAQTLSNALSIAWDNSITLEDEDAVWTESLTAPLRPGLECAPCKAWLTKTSMIWGSPKGAELNRLPAGAITGVSRTLLPDARETPIAWVHTNLISGIDLAVPLIFNQSNGAQARIDRDRFVSLFHPDLLIDTEPSPLAPWDEVLPEVEEAESEETDERIEGVPDQTLADDELIPGTGDQPAEPDFTAWDSAMRPSTLGTTGTGVTLRQILDEEPGLYGIDPGSMRLVEALAAWPSIEPDVPEPVESPAPLTEPDVLLAYLAKSRQAIAEVNENIDRRVSGNAALTMRSMPPSSSDQAAALLELIELGANGYYSAEQVARIKAEVAGLGEAAVRLRSLIELCNAGHMTISDAAAKRDRIMGGIAMLMETG